MSSVKWFDRKFDYSFGGDKYSSIYTRLQQAPEVLASAVSNVQEHMLVLQPEGKWSIKEHTGHLILLEPLWRTRIADILEGKPILTATDLANKATTEGGFNEYGMAALIEKFTAERKTTLSLLDSIDAGNDSRTSLHPRMQQPMRMIDIAYFVAEHDDHHVLKMRENSRL